MRIALLTGLVVACAASAFAGQTAQPPASAAAPGSATETMTLIGCVGGGAAATDPFMLSDASLASVAGTATPGQVATPTPAPVPAAAAAPAMPTAAGAPAMPTAAGAPATPRATAPPPPTAGAAGTSGTAGTAGTAGTVGTATPGAPAARPSPVGTPAPAPTMPAPAATATNPGSSPVAPSGYRLSGADVAGFRGQRVQIVGSLSQPGAANTGVREFKVQSVQAISGSCPQQ